MHALWLFTIFISEPVTEKDGCQTKKYCKGGRRRVGSKVFSDERILGSSEFVNNVIAEAEQKAKETLRLTLKISDLPSLALKVCEGQGVEEAELRSGFRKRELVKSRKIFCQIAVKKMGYSGADVAHFLDINTSAVNRLAVSDELPEVEKYV